MGREQIFLSQAAVSGSEAALRGVLLSRAMTTNGGVQPSGATGKISTKKLNALRWRLHHVTGWLAHDEF